MKITWKPDTCKCVIDQTNTPHTFIKQCTDHNTPALTLKTNQDFNKLNKTIPEIQKLKSTSYQNSTLKS